MGKNKKKGKQSSGRSHVAEDSVCKVVEDLWELLQASPSDQLPTLWAEYDRIQVLVNRLRELQGPCSRKPCRTSVMQTFEKWAQDNGAIYQDKVEIVESAASGFGLRAKRELKSEETVLVVPDKMMMTSLTALKGELGGLIRSDYMLQTMPNVALALHLLHESYSTSSLWKPYIDFLPCKFSLPLYFSKNELLLLQGSPCLSKSLLQIRNITKLYAHLHKIIRAVPEGSLLSLKSHFHYDDFLWAVACVMSRQNEIPSPASQSSPTLALIPLWDLCNHSSGTITTFFNVDTHTCDCYAMDNFKQSEEFKIFYGSRTNAELLMQQGFTYPQNKFDALQLKLGLSSGEEDKTKKLRCRLLEMLNIPISGTFLLLCCAENPVSSNLKAFMRIFTAPVEELEKWLSLTGAVIMETVTDSTWHTGDLNALQFLDVRCSLLLRTYSCDVLEDEHLLSTDKSLSDNARQIILLRKCEKTILSNTKNYIQSVKEELQKGECTATALEPET